MRKVLVYNGGAVALEPFPSGSEGGGANYIHQSTVLWDNAQVLHLPSQSLEIAPNPGANKIIMPIMGLFHPTIVAGYGNVSAGGYAVYADPNDDGEIGTYWQGSTVGGFLVEPYIVSGGPSDAPGNALVPEPIINMIGKALHFYVDNDGGGDFGGGHADNTLRHVLSYHIVDLATGLLVAA